MELSADQRNVMSTCLFDIDPATGATHVDATDLFGMLDMLSVQ